jgi:hypothetical protein
VVICENYTLRNEKTSSDIDITPGRIVAKHRVAGERIRALAFYWLFTIPIH